MRTNTKTLPTPKFTHEGARAYNTTAEQELRRLRRIFVRDNVRGDYDPLAGLHVINFAADPCTIPIALPPGVNGPSGGL